MALRLRQQILSFPVGRRSGSFSSFLSLQPPELILAHKLEGLTQGREIYFLVNENYH